MPKDLRSLAHVVVIPQRLAILRDSFLHAILEILALRIAIRLHHAFQENLFVLLTGRLVLAPRRTDGVVDWLKYFVEPSVEALVGVSAHML